MHIHLEISLWELKSRLSSTQNLSFFPSSIKGGRKQITPLDTKFKQLYDAIRDYREPKANRQLAHIFMKLPSKSVSVPQFTNKETFQKTHLFSFFVITSTGLSRLL